jgi:AcrR family transcriptional regulator
MTRRTQAERSDATTTQLIDAARRLFGRDGYAATSIDAVAAAAGVTKGAAYHHFANKEALFRAVFEREQAEIAQALERAADAAPDTWVGLRLGCRTFLEHCLDPGFRRIVLLDGVYVLGWEGVRDLQHDHVLRVLTEGMRAAAEDGWIADGDLTARCRLIHGALCEAGMFMARSADPAATLGAVAAEAERLLNAFATRR